MNPDESIDTLLTADILEPADDGFRVTETYFAEREACGERLRSDSESLIETVTTTAAQRRQLLEVHDDDPELVTMYATLFSLLEDADYTELLRLTIVLRQIEGGFPPNSGAPEEFLPIQCESLSAVVQLCRKGIVYIWREDCPPCDTVRESIEEALERQPSDFLLLSVYGPDCHEVLSREFNVEGAPTTLFIMNGEIDSRLVGARRPIAIESEIETVRERTT